MCVCVCGCVLLLLLLQLRSMARMLLRPARPFARVTQFFEFFSCYHDDVCGVDGVPAVLLACVAHVRMPYIVLCSLVCLSVPCVWGLCLCFVLCRTRTCTHLCACPLRFNMVFLHVFPISCKRTKESREQAQHTNLVHRTLDSSAKLFDATVMSPNTHPSPIVHPSNTGLT